MRGDKRSPSLLGRMTVTFVNGAFAIQMQKNRRKYIRLSMNFTNIASMVYHFLAVMVIERLWYLVCKANALCKGLDAARDNLPTWEVVSLLQLDQREEKLVLQPFDAGR